MFRRKSYEMRVGARVERGSDWKWGDQDGGKGNKGTVLECDGSQDTWVTVAWDPFDVCDFDMGEKEREQQGQINQYRWGAQGSKLDLKVVGFEARMSAPPPPPGQLEMGSRVRRGMHWKWKDQDGGKRAAGTIIGFGDKNWVRVLWDSSGESNRYRYGASGGWIFDLEPVPGQHARVPPPPPNRARMRRGVRVARGPDWKWGDQDKGGCGTVYHVQSSDWVRVLWDCGASNAYRYFADWKYDLLIDESQPVRSLPLPPRGSVEEGSNIVRGPDWKWGDQDGGKPGEVLEVKDDGWIKIKWANGATNQYRYGSEAAFDIMDVRAKDLPRIIPPVPPPGEMCRGARVERGPDWRWGDQDGGPGAVGSVVEVKMNGWVQVKWDGKPSNRYRYGCQWKFDLKVVGHGNPDIQVQEPPPAYTAGSGGNVGGMGGYTSDLPAYNAVVGDADMAMAFGMAVGGAEEQHQPPPPARSLPPRPVEPVSGGGGGVSSWTTEQLCSHLSSIGLGDEAELFRREKVDGAALMEFTAEDLKDELGLRLGPRKKIQALMKSR